MMEQTEEDLSKIISLRALASEEDDDDDQLVQEESETVRENIPAAPAPLTEDFEINDAAAMEEEIKNLRDLVQSLQEREIWLEMKLLEFHGMKEQEASMRELQNRLKISATEMKLLSLKIESLKAENEKLRAEASDYSRAVSELEICKKNIMILESKLRYVGEQAQEKMAVLHGRVTELREKEKKDLEDDLEVEKKLRLFNELENEVFELRKENSRLAQEKVGILKKFEAEHSLNASDLRSPDSVLRTLELWRLEEQNQLREENENLKKKLEQLQSDHCEDIEELVYLRWINACLRYELRNYQPPSGRTVARDLSRSLSPKSEQMAKQLILDYSNSHSNSNRLSSIDFDLDDCFSQTSSEEFDEASLDSAKTKSTKSSKSKLFRKLKKLVLPKGRNEEKNETRASFGITSGLSIEKKKNSTGVEFNGDEKWKSRRNHSHDLTRPSFDIQSLSRLNLEEEGNGGMHERCNCDIGAVYAHKRMISLDENSPYSSSVENEEVGDPTEDKLKKFARVFKDSKGSLRSKRLSASSSIV
ncbi:protein CHUP1, chloroplastic-like [Phalaenopsis equestris]|uniref:protein CHUP1, chloroplastic-like n=1 Tax=Phalaenopsis equestris TaxID=78828 RepID=UPI0009E29B9B|nr:protein CHUP1, chloroplastic-like [Phalaenopsis equestris]